ncbi:glycyl-radical enzyme activating protein [Treponema primitia]|uniref:glycyl-radical enzyme activating protein n=1 Tax=Treponema primitia TaxID=88058 RepID=UPI000319F91A|nr:glycyl-radical enzyme activating protein [Treponema primitia]
MAYKDNLGIITNIQRFSLDDGPGTRTTVFLKGCSVACKWCHNPETISPKKQLQYLERSCKNCGSCVKVCKTGAHFLKNGMHYLNWNLCNRCFACAETCLFGALSIIGIEITAEELGEQLLRDRIFYKRSGGGVTVSGGEPLLQVDFTAEIFRHLKNHGIHTALDTAGNVPWSSFEKVLSWIDLVLFDIKIVDIGKHQKMTGIKNQLILENFKKLLKEKVHIWVRTPLIKDINDDEEEANERIKMFMNATNIQKIELLPFHRYGIGKYTALGMGMEAHEFEAPSEERLDGIKSHMEAAGITEIFVS